MTRTAVSHILASNLVFLRNQRGLSQFEITKKSKVSLRLYQLLEAGQGNPSLETLCALAFTLQVNVSRLIYFCTLRLKTEPIVFIENYKETFAGKRYHSALRTIHGEFIWMNKNTPLLFSKESLLDHSESLLNLQPPTMSDLLQVQIDAEKLGMFMPYYLYYQSDKLETQGQYWSFYPIAVFPNQGKKPALFALYLNRHGINTDSNYYDYCANLLKFA